MANGERGKKGPYEKSARRLLKIWEGRSPRSILAGLLERRRSRSLRCVGALLIR